VVAVTFTVDDRARVPFALVGVVLLLGSATYAATLAHRPAPAERPDAVAAMDRVDATAATAVQRGTRRAARDAARAPVLVPADTPAGRAIGGNDTFRDYLRLRVYVAVREDLASAAVTVGEAQAVPSLPATPDADALATAIERVHLQRVDGGVRVRVENVTVTLHRNGRVVDRENRTVVRTVATPVLALHERVSRYDRHLNRGPAEGPGLGRRLTARVNAVAWTRGYAQYGGAPISNVLANRHVELMTNGALLSTQRAVFGREDPVGRQSTTRAAAIVGGTDVLMAGLTKADTVRALPKRPGYPNPAPMPKPPAPTRPPDVAEGNVTVGVDLTADRTYATVVGGDGPRSLNRTARSVYGAQVQVVGASRTVDDTDEPAGRPPGTNWTLAGERTSRTVQVNGHSTAPPPVSTGDRWHRLANHSRRVTVVRTTRKRWVRTTADGRETTTTTGTHTETLSVTVAVVGRHAPSKFAPARGIRVVHERGGPLGGPNLRGVPSAARDAVRRQLGGPDELVRLYLAGDLSRTIRVDGDRPDGLEEWLAADLAALRDRVRAISVTVPRTRLGAGEVNPAELLAERIRSRRAALVDAPASYGSVAAKARVAARAAYVEAVLDRLGGRADDARETRSAFDRVLADAGVEPATLSASLDVGSATERPPTHPVATGGPHGPLNASVSTTPAYLTLSGVTHDRLPSVPVGERYHPLVARNTNLFTLPYGDAADAVVAPLFDTPERTSLRSAARTLRSANRSLQRRADPELETRRDELQVEVLRALAYLRDRLQTTVARVDGVTRGEATSAVDAAFERWDGTAARAMAAANGSLAPAVTAEAERRLADGGERERELLAVRVRSTLASARERELARPRQPVVNRSSSLARRATRLTVKATIKEGAEATAGAVASRLDGKVTYPPAGLPVAPVPGYWYVTANVWTVTVRGEYLRFAVSVPAGPPGENVTYVRERGRVELDWDGDGVGERVGRTTRLSFSVSTASVVVVPPGGPGVGDRGGNADERSSGWPHPGNATSEVTTTSTGRK
jgi:hypothetical protein